MRSLGIVTAIVVLVSGCAGKFSDADYRFSERVGDGEHVRTFTFEGDPDASEIVIRPDFEFHSTTELILENGQHRMWNMTFGHPDVWEETEDTWSSPREMDDWSGTWTFTLKTGAAARYSFGFYFE